MQLKSGIRVNSATRGMRTEMRAAAYPDETDGRKPLRRHASSYTWPPTSEGVRRAFKAQEFHRPVTATDGAPRKTCRRVLAIAEVARPHVS